jgi:hypothetical protein
MSEKYAVVLTLLMLNLGVFSEFIYCCVWRHFELHVGMAGYSAVDSFYVDTGFHFSYFLWKNCFY